MIPPNKSRVLHFRKEEIRADWLKELTKKVGYTNMQDFYKLENDLGKGQFGLVKLATHIKDGYKTAIKVVKKQDMGAIDVYQQRREIEILKMC